MKQRIFSGLSGAAIISTLIVPALSQIKTRIENLQQHSKGLGRSLALSAIILPLLHQRQKDIIPISVLAIAHRLAQSLGDVEAMPEILELSKKTRVAKAVSAIFNFDAVVA